VYKNAEHRYEHKVFYADFPDNGEYLITLYIEDKEGNLSAPKTSKICVGDTDHDGMGDCWDTPDDDWLDSDNDGVPDKKDAFPENPDEQYDSDADGIGDNEDQDDDDDGIIDMLEEYYDTNPIVAEDGSGTCNLADYQSCKLPYEYLKLTGQLDSEEPKTTHTISGRLHDHRKLAVADVTIKVEGADGASREVVTNIAGFYSIEVDPEWEGRLIPSDDAYLFVPLKKEYEAVEEDHYGQDFLAAPLPETNEDASPDIESIQSGEWDDPNTWNLDRTPEADDIVRINEGHTVLFNPSDDEVWTEDTEDACKSGMISAMRERNRIKGLSNFGTLKSMPNRDITLLATDFIYNNGTIQGKDGLSKADPDALVVRKLCDSGGDNCYIYHPPSWAAGLAHGNSADSGRNVILTARNTFYNGPDGIIMGGRGGDHFGFLALGGDGGDVEVYADVIINKGKIGPKCSLNADGGHGGKSETPSGDWTTCKDSFSGSGGDVILLSDTMAINMAEGRIGSGKGGEAHHGHCNGYPGHAGHLLFTAPTTIQ